MAAILDPHPIYESLRPPYGPQGCGDAAHLKLLLDAAELGMWHWIPATGELHGCERFRALLGVAPGAPASLQTYLEHIHPQDRPRVAAAFDGARRSCGEYSVEFRAILPGGETRWLQSSGRAELQSLSGVVRDLTGERRLQEQGRLWDSTFAHSSHGMAIIDPATCTLRAVNAAYARLQGYRPWEMTGRSVFELYPPSEHEHWRQTVERSDRQGSAVTEINRRHRDGSLIPTMLDVVSVTDPDGSIRHRVVTVTDLRERERVRARLRYQEALSMVDQRFRLLAESAPMGIVLADVDGILTYANPAWLAITAVTLAQVLESDWFELVHADDRERVALAWQAMVKGSTFDVEFRFQRPSGEVRWVHSRATVIKDTAGAILGYVRMCLDITERLHARAATDRFHSSVRALARQLQRMREVERNELAGLLQDGVLQGLTGLRSDLQALAGDGHAPGELAARHSRLLRQTEATIESLRGVLFDLTPPGIGELGFTGAMRGYIAEQSARSGLRIDLSLPARLADLHQQTMMVLYSSAQEAVANAIEHGKPTRIRVSLELSDGIARLRIDDDGVGIGECDRHKPGCFGLLAASERLASVGGTLRVLGSSGQGTIFEASVPSAIVP